jgi:hypothetical protein
MWPRGANPLSHRSYSLIGVKEEKSGMRCGADYKSP